MWAHSFARGGIEIRGGGSPFCRRGRKRSRIRTAVKRRKAERLRTTADGRLKHPPAFRPRPLAFRPFCGGCHESRLRSGSGPSPEGALRSGCLSRRPGGGRLPGLAGAAGFRPGEGDGRVLRQRRRHPDPRQALQAPVGRPGAPRPRGRLHPRLPEQPGDGRRLRDRDRATGVRRAQHRRDRPRALGHSRRPRDGGFRPDLRRPGLRGLSPLPAVRGPRAGGRHGAQSRGGDGLSRGPPGFEAESPRPDGLRLHAGDDAHAPEEHAHDHRPIRRVPQAHDGDAGHRTGVDGDGAHPAGLRNRPAGSRENLRRFRRGDGAARLRAADHPRP